MRIYAQDAIQQHIDRLEARFDEQGFAYLDEYLEILCESNGDTIIDRDEIEEQLYQTFSVMV